MKFFDAVVKHDGSEIDSNIPESKLNEALQKAAEEGDVNIVQTLLQDGRANPSACSLQAMEYGVSPSLTASYALQMACYNGHHKVVQLLLDDGRSDVSANEYRCLKLAAQRNHEAVVRVLDAYLSAQSAPYKAIIGKALAEKIEGMLNLAIDPFEEPHIHPMNGMGSQSSH